MMQEISESQVAHMVCNCVVRVERQGRPVAEIGTTMQYWSIMLVWSMAACLLLVLSIYIRDKLTQVITY